MRAPVLSLHLENVRFSHSVFALPFAIAGACLAARDRAPGAVFPPLETTALVVAATVAARTCAMSANRLADASLDAANPRTAARPIPSGRLSRGAVLAVGAASAAIFVAAAFLLSPLCGAFALPVLAVLVGYSWTKRVTPLAHLALGLALALAPAGAWLAVRGDFAGRVEVPIVLGIGVLAWVAGFDVIYACQDAEHDRREGLRSIPASLGAARAVHAARVLHAVAVACFFATGVLAHLGAVYFATTGWVALMLAVQARVVRPDDLSRVNAALFTWNGWVGVGFLVGVVGDLARSAA
ncbi:MAG TPA: UbiA-like polyprenyltransferase [Planctomycetota bacterium]|nr:UbiA-like polyprenyltransferase [Planctomycetota bacterium]